MGLVLGIETSCDETAASVVDEEFHVLSSVIERGNFSAPTVPD